MERDILPAQLVLQERSRQKTKIAAIIVHPVDIVWRELANALSATPDPFLETDSRAA
jgi:hypothetical protein